MADARDFEYMAQALRLARNGLYTTHPNPRVGCVLVNDGVIVGAGWHERAGGPHAEAHALAQAGTRARGATAYVTLEPCCHHGRTPPCSDALLNAGVARVVAAIEDPHSKVAGKGLAQLRAAGVTVETGVLAAEAHELNIGFIQRMTLGRPWVRAKLAMSLDGRTALASGESQWITGPDARRDVQQLRAQSDAIVTGINTVLKDDPALNVRLDGATRQPLRVLLDPALATPLTARTLTLPGQVLILTAQTAPTTAWAALSDAGAEIVTLPPDGIGLDLPAVMAELARREINEAHLECGATLAGAMLRAGLLDELVIYMAPVLLGDGGRGLFNLHLEQMSERVELHIYDMRAVGRDWRITARPSAIRA